MDVSVQRRPQPAQSDTRPPSVTSAHSSASARPAETSSSSTSRSSMSRSPLARVRSVGRLLVSHITKHTGVGLVCAVAYFDPGNWSVDLQAGSQFGYHLLFIVLLSGILAIYWQVLASRLGVVTGLDLAIHTRLLLHTRGRYPRLIRWLTLYPLYLISEVAIIATDLAEVLGSGIALTLLFPSLPLWGGVLLTSADVFLLLLVGDPLRGRPVKTFEYFVGSIVLAVLVCMGVIVGRVHPHWGDVFEGFLPSKHIVERNGLYVSVGIVGATVMPHSLFLGSALAAQDRLLAKPKSELPMPTCSAPAAEPSSVFRMALVDFGVTLKHALVVRKTDGTGTTAESHREHENRSLANVTAHLGHAIADMIFSLLGFAVVINSFILILASAVFYYGSAGPNGQAASLFDAYHLIGSTVGKAAATLFAVSFLFSGQSAALVGTLAGQVVADGFVRWSAPPVLRRILTRTVALVPGMVVAAVQGQRGVDGLLVASQVVLAFCLPFVCLPLLVLTSSKEVMSVRKEHRELVEEQSREVDRPTQGQDEMVNFANGVVSQAFGWLFLLVLIVANVYVLVELARGKT